MISIVICTCNRVADLHQTLSSVATVCVPEGLPTELVVVDNASNDSTAEVVKSCHLPNMSVRYVHEPRPGKGYAYNTGIDAAKGRVLLFTDDDVRPPRNWIEGMCSPILQGRGAAVAGGVRIAPHLERPWMTLRHRVWLAATAGVIDPEKPEEMFGANMAFSRDVTAKVPSFDCELGPGALGFGDETLFSRQLRLAGYNIVPALNVEVEHHFQADRLSRQSFISSAKKHARTVAYIAYHWEHHDEPFARRRMIKRSLRLMQTRLKNRGVYCQPEGMSHWEMQYLQDVYFYKQLLVEQKRSRNYEKHGLVKLTHP